MTSRSWRCSESSLTEGVEGEDVSIQGGGETKRGGGAIFFFFQAEDGIRDSGQ